MAKSGSKFQTVLRVKKHQEKITQQQLIQIEHTHLKEKEVLDRLHEARQEAVNGTTGFGRARATDLQTQRAFIFKLTKQITNQSLKVDEIKSKANDKRKELTERAQSRQMVEKLDERRQAESAKIHDRKEQTMIDEVANRSSKKTTHGKA